MHVTRAAGPEMTIFMIKTTQSTLIILHHIAQYNQPLSLNTVYKKKGTFQRGHSELEVNSVKKSRSRDFFNNGMYLVKTQPLATRCNGQ